MKDFAPIPSKRRLQSAIRHVREGGIIAYPTEAVFALGCNPDNTAALQALLDLKGRPADKGLILIAAQFDQLLPYIDTTAVRNLNRILKTWPGPVTWLIRARSGVPFWLRGQHETIAVRVTNHPIAAGLCNALGKALVSTSANPAGFAPAQSALKTRLYFGDSKIFILKGAVGPERKPSAIFDARTLARLR